ncbi:Homeodomain-like DNA binding domain-containing transcription factor [Phycomyces blakesleeanus]
MSNIQNPYHHLLHKRLSDTQKELILELHRAGMVDADISTNLDIPTRTISRLVTKYETTGFVEYKSCPGRPRLLTPRKEPFLLSIIKKDHQKILAELAQNLKEETGKSVSNKTISKALDRMGVRYSTPSKLIKESTLTSEYSKI